MNRRRESRREVGATDRFRRASSIAAAAAVAALAVLPFGSSAQDKAAAFAVPDTYPAWP